MFDVVTWVAGVGAAVSHRCDGVVKWSNVVWTELVYGKGSAAVAVRCAGNSMINWEV